MKIHKPTVIGGANGFFWYANESNVFLILPDGEILKETLPTDFIPEVPATDPNHDLWLLGKSNTDQKLHLMKRTGAGKFYTVFSMPYFLLQQLYVGSEISVIIGSDLKDLPPERVMLQSRDSGKSWDRVPKPPDGIKVFFEGDKAIWLLGTMDRIQRLAN